MRRAISLGQRPGRGHGGQTIAEFALVVPFLVALFVVLMELVLAMVATVGVNRASQNGAHVAAASGNIAGADCLILRQITTDLGAPNDVANIREIRIERTALAGNLSYGQQRWLPSGPRDCQLPDGTTIQLPFVLTTSGYPESQRCTVLGGCPLLTPARSTVDNIGVRILYRHEWVTPLSGVMNLLWPGGAGGWTFEQRNIFRMEPTL